MQLAAASRERKSYIIDFVGTSLPPNLASLVTGAGGTLTTSFDPIGVAVATSSSPGFATRAAKIKGVRSVEEDRVIEWVHPTRVVEAGEALEGAMAEPNAAFGSAETFRRIQWVPDQLSAPAAWDLGVMGEGARVAILDGGIRSTHIDIAPNLDVARSRSFVPDTAPGTFIPFNFDQALDTLGVCRLPDTFWHATHVAGIVAAPGGPGNGNLGIVGIAPRATIIGVKVLHCGEGAFSSVINGILYAATPIAEGGAGADIINMSLGALFEHQERDTLGKILRDTTGHPINTAPGAARLARAIGKATSYAYQHGVTVIAAMGNEETNLDKTNDLVAMPAMAPHVIAVAATGPVGFGLGATNFDRPASYTNFGQSAVSFAAGGGDFVLPGDAFCSKPRNPSGTITTFCWIFDLVMAPCRGGGTSNSSYCFSAGTSMASPAVAGVAALIIGKYGRVGPAEVERRLRQSADDLGKPGNDDFYGGGRVNALRAVQ